MGHIPPAGNGVPVQPNADLTITELEAAAWQTNSDLLAGLREDEHSEALAKSSEDDAELMRMTPPCSLAFDDLCTKHLSPRFGVEQGKPIY